MVLVADPAWASEAVFKAVRDYTVDIRALIDTPFIEDEHGAVEGAGFLVDKASGWIITNVHVVGASPSSVQVAFRDRPFVGAVKHYLDPHLDIAVIRIDPGAIPDTANSAPLSCGDVPPVGHPVGAFGHPWNLRFTGTRGIVSGFSVVWETAWLQTDAPLNSGNSGGPLVSLETGKVVGVNAAVLDKSATENLNFAVPMIYVCRILDLLRRGGDPTPPTLPVVFTSHRAGDDGLFVAATDGAPDTAFEVGDVVLRIDGVPDYLGNATELVHHLRGSVGERTFVVLRAGQEVTVRARLRPGSKLLERRGLSFTRLVIGPTPMRDAWELGDEISLMIHSGESSDTSCSSDLGPWQHIVSVDGRGFGDIAALYEHLDQSQRNRRSVHLLVKMGTDLPDRLWEYLECTLPVENLRMLDAGG